MMNVKEQFVMELLNGMLDICSSEQLVKVKDRVNAIVYNYDIREITTTEISAMNGDMTRYLMNYFKVAKLSSGKSEKTLEQYDLVVNQLCDMCHKDLNMITSDDIMFFLVNYKKVNGVSGCTMDNKRRCLSSVFTFLHKHNKISQNPMAIIEPVKYDKCVKVPLTDEEIELLRVNCSNERDLAMINFMLDSGVRVSEMCSIKLKDVDFKNYSAKVMGKGRKERIVSWTGETAVRINEYLKTRKDISFDGSRMIYDYDAPLFSSLRSPYHPLCKCGAESILKKIGYRCDIQRVHPHLLRATCATRLSKNGVDIGYIAKYLGHANLDSIDRYVLINDVLLNNKIRNVGLVS